MKFISYHTRDERKCTICNSGEGTKEYVLFVAVVTLLQIVVTLLQIVHIRSSLRHDLTALVDWA